MDNYKLIEERIKIDKINKDGKVFERGKRSQIILYLNSSLKDRRYQPNFQVADRTRHQH